MASPTYQTQSAVTAFNAGSPQTVDVPSGTTNGDLLVWITHIGGHASGVTMSYGAGFTALDSLAPTASATGWDIRYRVASSEPANYSIEQTTTGYFGSISYMIRISGIGGTPIAGTATKSSETGTGPISIPSVTTTEADTLLLAFGFQLNDNTVQISAAGGLTEVLKRTTTVQSLSAREAIAASGTVSGRTMTVSGSGTFSKYAFLVSSGTAGASAVKRMSLLGIG